MTLLSADWEIIKGALWKCLCACVWVYLWLCAGVFVCMISEEKEGVVLNWRIWSTGSSVGLQLHKPLSLRLLEPPVGPTLSRSLSLSFLPSLSFCVCLFDPLLMPESDSREDVAEHTSSLWSIFQVCLWERFSDRGSFKIFRLPVRFLTYFSAVVIVEVVDIGWRMLPALLEHLETVKKA